MRTLVILAVILLVALQAQAEPLQARTDEDTAAQEQIPADNPEVVVSFAWDESLAPKNSGLRKNMACYCRIPACLAGERRYGTCYYQGRIWAFCC
ncbi:PREDICTED: neutrophil defensin 1 isoform X2 [Colobus angolensis palliatus]|uniref:Mammalian defensins domain-containing protein n=2 Tax=Colobus angolensis palliatus TaxID=336983 RepID=A0A2K5K499_COLAP|nr:PREDICTED: neutrophil defensin 1 isoform X2 [Colobus angolensis palliatus]